MGQSPGCAVPLPCVPREHQTHACPQIPALPVPSLPLPPCSWAWALVCRAAVLAGPREAAGFPKVPGASGGTAADNSQPLRGEHHAHRKAKAQEQKGRLKVATDLVPCLMWLAHFFCQLVLVFAGGRLGSLCHRQQCCGQGEARAGAARVGTGSVGSVAAMQRGGKAEERPVVILTK